MSKTALIIATYKQARYLRWILQSIHHQIAKPDEIIIAEDAQDADTAAVVAEFRTNSSSMAASVVHVCQEDSGFRKSTILNKAVAKATAENLIFLDGDCIPHPAFVFQCNKYLRPGVLLFSRPVYLSESFIASWGEGRSQWVFSISELLRAKSRSVEAGVYLPFKKPREKPNRALIGNGWACSRTDYLAVNGFDETFNIGQYGFEDTDIHHRLTRIGVKGLMMKNLAVYYHFGRSGIGELKTDSRIETNRKLMQKNDAHNLIKAPIGLDQWL